MEADRMVRSAREQILVVHGLEKSLGRKDGALRILDDITLHARPGEFLTIVGPSGCGKTTLLMCLAGLYGADSGKIEFDGRSVDGPPEGVSVVFQDYSRSLMPWKKNLSNVFFGMRRVPGSHGSKMATARQMLAAVGLGGFEDRYPWELSGGMQQRVAIARALATNSKLLLLDEPLAAVDAQTRADMQDLLLRLAEQFGKTCILVTHDVEEAVYMADRVLVLSGRPTRVDGEIAVRLAKPRDQLTTREDPEFLRIRHEIFSRIPLVQDEEMKPKSVVTSTVLQGRRKRNERISRDQVGSTCACCLRRPADAGAAYALDSVKVGYMKIPPLVHIIYGVESGIFQKHGLEIDLSVLNGGPELLSALSAGSVDISMTSSSAVLMARAAGLKLKAFGTADLEEKGDYRNWIVGSEESGTTSLKDLEGKTVGVVAKASGAELLVRDHMVRAGADPNKVNFVALPFPQLPTALEVGNVQGIMVSEPFHSQIMASKKVKAVELGRGLIASVQDGDRIAIGGWFARDNWLSDPKNQDIARRFLDAVMEANVALDADRSKINAIFEKDFGMPPAVAAAVDLPLNTVSLVADPKDYAPIIDAYLRTGMIPADKIFPVGEAVETLGLTK